MNDRYVLPSLECNKSTKIIAPTCRMSGELDLKIKKMQTQFSKPLMKHKCYQTFLKRKIRQVHVLRNHV